MNKQSEKLKVTGEKYKICATDFEGITLVALVITIIVLIILAGVSINAVMNKGLITNAKDARDQYEKSKTKEEIDLGKLVQEVENAQGSWVQDGVTITNKNDNSITLTVGEYVAYTPNANTEPYVISTGDSGWNTEQTISQNEKNWRVLGVNEYGRLELISGNATEEQLYLSGYQGYNNGVYLLNDICNKLYGNSENRTIGRSMNMDDILKVAEFSYTDDESGMYGLESGEFNGTYPSILAEEIKQKVNGKEGILGQSEQETKINQTREQWESTADILDLKSTYFYKEAIISSDFKYTEYGELLFYNGTDSWLATRTIGADSDYAVFGLQEIFGTGTSKGDIDGSQLCDSGGGGGFEFCRIRPIVTLGSSLTIDTTVEGKDGSTPEQAWVLK